MATCLHEVLLASYAPKLPLAERANLSLKEKRTTYKCVFDQRRESIVFQIDGHIIREGRKCDCLILAKQDSSTNPEWKAVFVELKGTDVAHGITQLDATIDNRLFRHPSVTRIHARVVAKSFPANKAFPEYEKAKRAFKSKHKDCTFKQVLSGQPDLIP